MPERAKRKAAPRKKPAAKPKSATAREKLSIVFSFRNEREVLDELLNRLHAVLDPMDLDLEFIFVNDNSTDGSLDVLLRRAETDPAIRIINMSARFGVNPCFLAGMRAATGDAVITMDTDLQDPPEVIPDLIEKWRAGCDVVHTTRLEREGESWLKKVLTRTAYRIINAFSEVHLPVDTGMFKLASRRAVDVLTNLNEVDMYFRGLMIWVGFEQDQVFYKREERFAGQGHFPLTSKDPWLEFIRALFSFSRVPVAFLAFAGALIAGLGLLAVILLPILHATGRTVTFEEFGLATIVFLGGANLFGLGIVGIYVTRTYHQVRGRPEYIVESRIGFE
jgi:polyisoprenyl-phosphate glycosyltransferase